MSFSGVFKEIKRVTRDIIDPGGIVTDAWDDLTGTDDLGKPPKVEDPKVTMAREAKNSAIAGDIAVRNARQRSSTLGAGSRFIEQQMSKKPKKPSGLSGAGAGSNLLSGGM